MLRIQKQDLTGSRSFERADTFSPATRDYYFD